MQFLTCTQLESLNENELRSLFIKTRAKINKNKRLNKLAQDLEIYYCYIVREIERRSLMQHYKSSGIIN